MSEKAEIFTDRREFLLATTGDGRKAWSGHITLRDAKGTEITDKFYGLANTEHQFRVALSDKFGVKKLTRDELHAEMRAELAKSTEEEAGRSRVESR